LRILTVMIVLAGLGLSGSWYHDAATVGRWAELGAERARGMFGGLAQRPPSGPVWRWAAVTRGDLVWAVNATGTLRPVATVSVPATAGGAITALHADFNDSITQGQPIALIDTTILEIAVQIAAADRDVALAGIETQGAAIRRAEAALESARFDLRAVQASAENLALQVRDAERELARREAQAGTLSRVELERTTSALEGALIQARVVGAQVEGRAALVNLAEADLEAARSQLVNQRAVLRQREAVLRMAEIELERSIVRAPVDGIVIGRDAEIGQTVHPGSPLFTIAQDLRAMQVNASIDESEIGRIVPGQMVEFTVDAFRNQLFTGTVDQIRQTPQVQQNVVTYTVVVRAANPDLRLLPGMTANARFIIDRRSDVITVPNAALRFAPPDSPFPAGRAIWVDDGSGGLRPIPVERGISDETHTQITGEGLDGSLRAAIGAERLPEGQPRGRLLVGGF
jgi:HlyD family secretion protein